MNRLILLLLLLIPAIGFGQCDDVTISYFKDMNYAAVKSNGNTGLKLAKVIERVGDSKYFLMVQFKDEFPHMFSTKVELVLGDKSKYYFDLKDTESAKEFAKLLHDGSKKEHFAFEIPANVLQEMLSKGIKRVHHRGLTRAFKKGYIEEVRRAFECVVENKQLSKKEIFKDADVIGFYNLKLVEVTNQAGIVGSVSKNNYSDDVISIDWSDARTQLGFEIQNRSDKMIRIVWNDAAYIGSNGKTSRVFHKGIKYTNKELSQPDSPIYAKSSLSDLVAPTDYSELMDNEWVSRPLVGSLAAALNKTVDKLDKSLVGGKIRVVLPIVHGDTTIEYNFTFETEFKEWEY